MEPKIIVVAQTKGGVGKTTIALQLACWRALQGKKVWVVDGDRQCTAQTALALRGASEIKPGIACAAYSEGKLLRTQVLLQKDNFDTVIIDVGGMDSGTLRAAVSLCDVMVVPFQPRSFDIWGLQQLTAVLEEVQSIRGDFPALAVLNSADPSAKSTDNKEAIEALDDFPLLTFVPAQLGRRKAFATTSSMGIGVSEAKSKDSKAIAEMDALAQIVFSER